MSTENNIQKIHVALYPFANNFEVVRDLTDEEIFQRAPACSYTMEEVLHPASRLTLLDRPITTSSRYTTLEPIHRRVEKFLATSWAQLTQIMRQLKDVAFCFVKNLGGDSYAIEAYEISA